MERPEIDLRSASVARIFDYYLGGAHNFAVDRELADAAAKLMPELPRMMHLHRRFLARAMRYVVEQGVTQFLDLGSGLPTPGGSLEVARRLDPFARVVHVDIDPVVGAHGKSLLGAADSAVVVGDMCEPDAILDHPETRRVLDFDRPIGLLLVGVLDFVGNDVDLPGVLARYRDRVVPGSHIVLTNFSVEGGLEDYQRTEQLYRDNTTIDFHPRSAAEVTELLAGFELAEPGVVDVSLWRPEAVLEDLDEHPKRSAAYVAVGRKP
ncbi:SAM-dependent methyltransferase [Kutzneria sp. CA-103260]|uniref:SAM-dependent methyltransferase n=1 Tax=Kutzneria sp. CA-103260 TaxID=2802641 RepID=UPI001BAC276E|nr:SAM-dependent methyltransferase [Kutzneria sp. CA-103260]QUQ70267.1 SAM-dependent methyltransferase [Kutzneria sp. CA-103260]